MATSALSMRRSWNRDNTDARSLADHLAQDRCARLARATAATTSSLDAAGITPITSSVKGALTSMVPSGFLLTEAALDSSSESRAWSIRGTDAISWVVVMAKGYRCQPGLRAL